MKAFEKYFRTVLSLMLYKLRWFQLLKLQLLKYLHVNTHTPLHEQHERFPIIKECIPNNLIDLTFIYMLYYFAGLNEYSTIQFR